MKATLKATLFTLLALFVITAVVQAQQGPVVPSAAFLRWEDSNGQIDGFNVYLRRQGGIVPDGNPTSFVTWTVVPQNPDGTFTFEWPISAQPGQWFVVVTSVMGGVESLASNEIPFFVLDSPAGLRVEIP